MKSSKLLALTGLVASAAITFIGSGVASADPSDPQPPYRTLQGQGSDTTEAVMGALSEVVKDGSGNKLIASYDAVSTTGFQTRSSSNCIYKGNPSATDPAGGGSNASTYVEGYRANGSGNGRNALRDAVTSGKTTFGCLDYARSSSYKPSGNGFNATYIPFAKDAVSFAVTNTSAFPRVLTLADLKAIYTCQYTGVNGSAGGGYKALIPQAGSGTRGFWLGVVGLTDDTNATTGLGVSGSFPCVSDQTDGGARGGSKPLEEHKAKFAKNNMIVPVSVAQYIAQSEGTIGDDRGRAILGAISDGSSTVSYPMSLNTSYGNVGSDTTLNAKVTRDVYNVVPTANISPGSTLNDVFVGSTSKVCSQIALIAKYGFGVLSNCGDTSLVGSSG